MRKGRHYLLAIHPETVKNIRRVNDKISYLKEPGQGVCCVVSQGDVIDFLSKRLQQVGDLEKQLKVEGLMQASKRLLGEDDPNQAVRPGVSRVRYASSNFKGL